MYIIKIEQNTTIKSVKIKYQFYTTHTICTYLKNIEIMNKSWLISNQYATFNVKFNY